VEAKRQRPSTRCFCSAGLCSRIVIVLIAGVLILITMITTDFGNDLSLETVQSRAAAMQKYVGTHYARAALIFVFFYVAINLWFPGAFVMGLLCGFLFGAALGAVYLEIGTVIGAVLAFEVSRKLLGNWAQHRWRRRLQGFNKAISKHGDIYLLLVRLFPVTPYFLVNLFAGLTKVRLTTFNWTTELGSLPGILIICYAGGQLRTLKSVDQILSLKVILAFMLLAAFVCLAIPFRWMLNR